MWRSRVRNNGVFCMFSCGGEKGSVLCNPGLVERNNWQVRADFTKKINEGILDNTRAVVASTN